MEHFWFIRIIYPPPPPKLFRENGICTSKVLNFNIDPLNKKITVQICGLPGRCSTVVLGFFCFSITMPIRPAARNFVRGGLIEMD